MKNITCFITSLSSGGAEHQLSVLSNLLVSDGYNVTLSTFSDIEDHYTLSPSIKRTKIGKNKGRILKFFCLLKYFLFLKTDCIISFGQRENFFMLIPFLFRKTKIKIIAGERNLTIGKQSFREKLLFNLLYKRATYIVPNSYSQKEYILNKNKTLANKLLTITNFTDTDKYYPMQDERESGILQIGVLCRYAKQKNYKKFAEAIKIVKERLNVPFIVNWYGNINSTYDSVNPDYIEFKRLVDVYHLNDVIKLNDKIDKINKTLNSFDVFCLPSLHEGFSNSLSEAICCGLPVVASDVSDNSLMIKNGINGYLFNPYDVEDIAEKIIKILNLGSKERKEMSVQSRNLSLTLFDKDKFLNEYITIIEK